MPTLSAQPEVHYRIGFVSGFFIIAAAVFFDAIGFLLMLTGIGEIMTEIIGFCASILFFIWFLFLRVSYFSGRATAKLGIMGAGSLIEMIPFVNGIAPMFTVETATLIHITRKEDREKAEKENAKRVTTATSVLQQTEQQKAQYLVQYQQMQQQVLESQQDNAIEEETARAA